MLVVSARTAGPGAERPCCRETGDSAATPDVQVVMRIYCGKRIMAFAKAAKVDYVRDLGARGRHRRS